MSTAKTRVRVKAGSQKFGCMSPEELERFMKGEMSYIRTMTWKDAERRYPAVKGLPKVGLVFLVCDADGEQLALTDTWHAALGYARGGNRNVVYLQ